MKEAKKGDISYPTDKDIRFAHSLKIDAGPVIILTETGMQNFAKEEFVRFYKKQGLSDEEIKDKEKELQKRIKEMKNYEALYF